MSAWISNVKNVAFDLEAAGVSLIDEDVILALTAGLLDDYSTFIVALDSLSPSDLTLSNIITWLLNKEVWQDPELVQRSETEHYVGSVLTAAAAKQKWKPVNQIRCYNFRGKGHYQVDFPLPKHDISMQPVAGEEDNDNQALFAF